MMRTIEKLEGLSMDTYKKWFDGIRRDEEVPEVVRQTVQDTLQWLPDVPEKQQKNSALQFLSALL